MFRVGVAVNSKRTINEARSIEIWPQYHPNFAIQESRLQAAGSPWSSGKSKDHARSLGPTKTRRRLLRKAFRKLGAHDINTIILLRVRSAGCPYKADSSGLRIKKGHTYTSLRLSTADLSVTSATAPAVADQNQSVPRPPESVSFDGLSAVNKRSIVMNG